MRMKEDYDGAEPSGNSVAALNLLRLAQMTDRKDFRDSAEQSAARLRLAHHGHARGRAADAGGVRIQPVEAEADHSGGRRVGGGHAGNAAACLHGRFLPDRIVMLVDGDAARKTLAGYLSGDRNHDPRLHGKTTAYVCENYTCKLPTADAAKFAELQTDLLQ